MTGRGLRRYTSTYQVSDYPILLGSGLDFVATRIAYKLDLRGPCLSLQTACSTSLVAIVQACQSLLCYACDMALAGGVSITLPQKRGYHYQEGGMVSPDGVCRTFDAAANGTVFGSGAGIVLLKRLADALADGDHIYALIKGSAINNDGASKVGFTAPSVDGQAAVISAAQEAAGVDARSISYVECHGTATPLGDPIEIAALSQAFRLHTADQQFCAVGSAKPNVGHLDAAAGVTGLIKAALSLHHRVLPGTLHYRAPNPAIDFKSSPFFVDAETRPWRQEAGPLRAAVSAFGVGGTNAHVVLQEAPSLASGAAGASHSLLVLSGRSEAALQQALPSSGGRSASASRSPDRGGRAHAAGSGGAPLSTVPALSAAGPTTPSAASKPWPAGRRKSLHQRSPPVVFMFPGQGAQYPQMGMDLYRGQAEFRRQIDACAEVLRGGFGIDLHALLYPQQRDAESDRRLMETTAAQPAIFSVQYALARLWMAWGIVPDMMIGHSVGELVAACIAGVFTLEEGLGLVAERGRLMQALPGGAMLAVRLPEADMLPLLGPGLDIAAVNGPRLCVVSGPYEAVAALEAVLQQRGDGCRRLHTSHAFHSAMVDPVVAPLAERVSRMALAAPAIPYVSCVTGTWIGDAEAMSAQYWARHCREPVRFAEGLAVLMNGPDADEGRPLPILIEVGPGNTLQTLALQGAARGRREQVLPSLPDTARERPDLELMLASLGALWVAGSSPDWGAARATMPPGRVALPTYPFQRSRYWIDETPARASIQLPGPVLPETAPGAPGIPAALIHMPPRIAENTMQQTASTSSSAPALPGVGHLASYHRRGYRDHRGSVRGGDRSWRGGQDLPGARLRLVVPEPGDAAAGQPLRREDQVPAVAG